MTSTARPAKPRRRTATDTRADVTAAMAVFTTPVPDAPMPAPPFHATLADLFRIVDDDELDGMDVDDPDDAPGPFLTAADYTAHSHLAAFVPTRPANLAPFLAPNSRARNAAAMASAPDPPWTVALTATRMPTSAIPVPAMRAPSAPTSTPTPVDPRPTDPRRAPPPLPPARTAQSPPRTRSMSPEILSPPLSAPAPPMTGDLAVAMAAAMAGAPVAAASGSPTARLPNESRAVVSPPHVVQSPVTSPTVRAVPAQVQLLPPAGPAAFVMPGAPVMGPLPPAGPAEFVMPTQAMANGTTPPLQALPAPAGFVAPSAPAQAGFVAPTALPPIAPGFVPPTVLPAGSVVPSVPAPVAPPPPVPQAAAIGPVSVFTAAEHMRYMTLLAKAKDPATPLSESEQAELDRMRPVVKHEQQLYREQAMQSLALMSDRYVAVSGNAETKIMRYMHLQHKRRRVYKPRYASTDSWNPLDGAALDSTAPVLRFQEMLRAATGTERVDIGLFRTTDVSLHHDLPHFLERACFPMVSRDTHVAELVHRAHPVHVVVSSGTLSRLAALAVDLLRTGTTHHPLHIPVSVRPDGAVCIDKPLPPDTVTPRDVNAKYFTAAMRESARRHEYPGHVAVGDLPETTEYTLWQAQSGLRVMVRSRVDDPDSGMRVKAHVEVAPDIGVEELHARDLAGIWMKSVVRAVPRGAGGNVPEGEIRVARVHPFSGRVANVEFLTHAGISATAAAQDAAGADDAMGMPPPTAILAFVTRLIASIHDRATAKCAAVQPLPEFMLVVKRDESNVYLLQNVTADDVPCHLDVRDEKCRLEPVPVLRPFKWQGPPFQVPNTFEPRPDGVPVTALVGMGVLVPALAVAVDAGLVDVEPTAGPAAVPPEPVPVPEAAAVVPDAAAAEPPAKKEGQEEQEGEQEEGQEGRARRRAGTRRRRPARLRPRSRHRWRKPLLQLT
ncbi:hypothetical protein AMAG_20113 [Allomyces macrogynus ATCC 38327]|uniref:Little elongation complex subunit 2 C-terminal domain-containing protein n=1 Tax=Allomyces macrogynus (strain ATCC 38327) TaxID=578462 RepID=A0A0L0T6K6_ALLM3|nr:hypothetical protein AMAG_20113 [Allomyces macrogynus ATCC 38327]|eukprot:KNE70433.1 hypothetical protein AMAG_20113 [Allomyces macrogynus ATCC 38327]